MDSCVSGNKTGRRAPAAATPLNSVALGPTAALDSYAVVDVALFRVVLNDPDAG